MANFSKIECSEIKLGMKFPAPVFFDDGENLFIAENKTVKAYHIAALSRWNIPFLLLSDDNSSDLEELDDTPLEEICELEDVSDAEDLDDVDDVEDLEVIEL